GSGRSRRRPLESLTDCDFVGWTRHFESLLSMHGRWGGVLPPHLGQKTSRRPFSNFLLGVPLCGRRVFSCKSSGQVDPMSSGKGFGRSVGHPGLSPVLNLYAE